MALLTGGARVFEADTSTLDSTAQHSVGIRAMDSSGNEYVYGLGVASTAANSWVTFDEAYATTLAVADGIGRVGIAMAAIVASTYGWYQVWGSATGKVLTGFADNKNPYLTSTDGSVDDTDVAGDAVLNAWGRSAIASGVATFELNYPSVHNIAID